MIEKHCPKSSAKNLIKNRFYCSEFWIVILIFPIGKLGLFDVFHQCNITILNIASYWKIKYIMGHPKKFQSFIFIRFTSAILSSVKSKAHAVNLWHLMLNSTWWFSLPIPPFASYLPVLFYFYKCFIRKKWWSPEFEKCRKYLGIKIWNKKI